MDKGHEMPKLTIIIASKSSASCIILSSIFLSRIVRQQTR